MGLGAVLWVLICAGPVDEPAPQADLSLIVLTSDALAEAYRDFKHDKLDAAERGLRRHLDQRADAATTPPLRYLLAEVLRRRAEKLPEASRAPLLAERAAVLASIADYPPLLAPVHLALGEWAEKRADRAAALAHYRRVPDGSPQQVPALVAAARLELQSKNARAALDLARAAVGRSGKGALRDEARLVLGESEHATGNVKGATRTLRELWLERGDSALGRRARGALQAMNAAPSAEDELVRQLSNSPSKGTLRALAAAAKKRSTRLEAGARALVQGIVDVLVPKTLARGRAALEKAAGSTHDSVAALALDQLGALQAKGSDVGAAIASWTKLADRYRDQRLAPLALGRIADAARAAGKVDLAHGALATLAARYPEHPLRVEQRWQEAWQAWRDGKPERAADALARLRADHGGTPTLGDATWDERASYWLARADEARGRRNEAFAGYERLVRDFPLTYYSNLAFHRLDRLDHSRAVALRPLPTLDGYDLATLVDLDRLRITRHPALETAIELIRIGLFDAARRDLQARAEVRALGVDGHTLRLSLGLRQRQFWLGTSVVRWRGALTRYPDAADERLWKLAYPLPFWDHVERACTDAGVSPWFLMGLIRHESAYNPKIVSYANAVGLTQLLLGTARTVAKKLLGKDTKAPTWRSLKTPAVNVRIGSRFVAELMSHFGHNEALVLAAYNAGPNRIRRWWRTWRESGRKDTAEWVEEIPYKATQSYVKSVLASYGAYLYLYGPRGVHSTRVVPIEAELPATLGPYFGRPEHE